VPHRTAVILAVALTEDQIGAHTPNLLAFKNRSTARQLAPGFPAVTCTVQSNMLTGAPPRTHGIVGNGWYEREQAEVRFWKQPEQLVRAPKVWEIARERDPSVTCAKMFWWYNMHGTADFRATPRPQYPADGRKIPDIYTDPPELRDELQDKLGAFPLFRFWGPAASIESSRWIADASMRVDDAHDPTLSLIYLPHLDYALQKFGPGSAEAKAAAGEIDAVLGPLIEHLEARDIRVIVTGEYAIEPATTPVFPNRALREAGLLRVRDESTGEQLDTGGSRAFAVCDHQVAHVYVRDAGDIDAAAGACAGLPGVGRVLRAEDRGDLAHERAGDLILTAKPGAWFAYPFWLDDGKAPDYARTVDIHRKPGYDPCELFIDPAIRLPKLAIASRLVRKKVGFRTLMDLIPLDASLVKGTHGRVGGHTPKPIIMGPRVPKGDQSIPDTEVRDLILEHLFSE